MKYFIYFIFIILLLGLMLGLFSSFRLFGTTPDLILLFVLFCAVEESSFDPYFAALVGGLAMDIISGFPLGSFLGGFIILVFLCQVIFGQVIYFQFQLKYIPVLVIIGEALLFVWLWAYNSVIFNFHWTSLAASNLALWSKFLPNLLYTLVLMYPMHWMVAFVLRKIKLLSVQRKA